MQKKMDSPSYKLPPLLAGIQSPADLKKLPAEQLPALAAEVREVLIPDIFDDTFTAYNALQLQAGLDLSPYHGKRVKCWTYTVRNYPASDPVQAHLYLYKDRVIGGDISSAVQDGFQLPLTSMDPI